MAAVTGAPEPTNERARQSELDSYGVVDTPPEPAFERLVALAARMLETPMSMVTLIDGERQWFKARVGLEPQEGPRKFAFCAHTILSNELLVVEDARHDPRFEGNPWVVGPPFVRFYAGAPLITPAGLRIGAFAVMDPRARPFAAPERALLRDLAALAMDELELRQKNLAARELHSATEKRTGGELRRALERLELVARATSDVVWDWDLVSDGVWWNQNFSSTFGYALDEIGRDITSWTARVHPDDCTRVVEGIHRLIDSGGESWSGEYRFRRRDGTWADILDRGYVIHEGGRPVRMIGAMMDVTGRRRNEKAQAALYRIAEAASVDSDMDGFFRSVHRIVGELMFAPNLFVAIYDAAAQTVAFPYAVDERGETSSGPIALRRGLTDYILRTGQSLLLRTRADFDALAATGQVELVGEASESWLGVPLRTQERTVGVLATQLYGSVAPYEQRDLDLLQFVSTQVAHAIARKQAEAELRASEQRFRALIEHSSDAIAVLSQEGEALYRSPVARRMLGLRPDTAPRIFDVVHPDDLAEVRAKFSEALASPGLSVELKSRARSSDGKYGELEVVLTNLLADPAVRGVVLNFRDVSERTSMEARLRMADRMASVGTLAAGVAHEINNPLAYVVANLGYVGDALARTPGELARQELVEAVREAQDGAERVRRIVRDMKMFSRGDDEVPGPVDVRLVIDAAANVAWNEIRHRARLVKDHAHELPCAQATESRLGQVFLNLLINAAQAIREGSAAENEIRIASRQQGARVIVTVSDTGAGIEPEVLARLFDPFFTTKRSGEGTGLGLFICQNIVTALGGIITVASEPGRGSAFTVELPVAEVTGPSTRKAPDERVAVRRGRVLVIDDEPLIRTVVARTLKQHEVSGETAAQAALERIRAGERFDVILCDVMMPQMSGVDFYALLEKDVPEQAARVVFITGGAFTQAAQQFLDRVTNPKVTKPFDVRDLRALVDARVRAG